MIVWMLAWSALAGVWEAVEQQRSSPEAFALLSPRERWDLAVLVRDVVRHAPMGELPAELAARADGLGWVLEDDAGVAVLREQEARGGGLLAVRLGPVSGELVLQAPHPWFDLNTGRIACRAFEESSLARALIVATVHRNAAPESDAAHSPEQGFQALTQGVVAGLAAPSLVQIHGYAETTEADAVVSPGATWTRPEAFEERRQRLAVALGADDVRTGAEVPELAATTNVQGRLVTGEARFLHLELSKAQRDRLLAEPAARAALIEALLEGESR